MKSLNINGLLAHIDELRVFLTMAKIDILAINEKKIDSSISNNEIHISGFDIARNDRIVNGEYGDGVLFYIRNNLNYQIR